MIASLAQGLARRSPRERMLLVLLAGVVIPAGLVFLVVLPLQEQRSAARAALRDSEATRAWYVARQAEITALPASQVTPDAADRVTTAPIGLGGIEARLIESGLRDAVTLLANTQGASVALTLAAVPFGALMDWIEGIERDAGYRLSALQLERGDDGGLVNAEFRLEPRR